jgi:hypothetical protein
MAGFALSTEDFHRQIGDGLTHVPVVVNDL